jgi:hypothetical protein
VLINDPYNRGANNQASLYARIADAKTIKGATAGKTWSSVALASQMEVASRIGAGGRYKYFYYYVGMGARSHGKHIVSETVSNALLSCTNNGINSYF